MKLFTSLAVLVAVPLLILGAAEEDKTCPISKKPGKDDIFLEVNGKKVHFCCNNCPKAYAKKINLKGGAEALAASPAACPLSGNPGKADFQVVKKTSQLLSFCCGNCLKKSVDGNKLALKDEGPKNCPLSGKPATAEQSLLVNGESVYFCCANCRKGYAKKIGISAEVLAKEPEACPISGRPATKEQSLVLVKSELISFCCGNCKNKYVTANFKDGQVIDKKKEAGDEKSDAAEKEKKKVRL